MVLVGWCDSVILSVCSSFPPSSPEKKIKGSEADLALWPGNSCGISFWMPGVKKPKLRSTVLLRAAQACAGGRGAGPGGPRGARVVPASQSGAAGAACRLQRGLSFAARVRISAPSGSAGAAVAKDRDNWRAAGWGPGLLPQKRRGIPAESPSPPVGRGVRETAFLRGSRSRRSPFREPAPLGRFIRWMTRCSVKGLCRQREPGERGSVCEHQHNLRLERHRSAPD